MRCTKNIIFIAVALAILAAFLLHHEQETSIRDDIVSTEMLESKIMEIYFAFDRGDIDDIYSGIDQLEEMRHREIISPIAEITPYEGDIWRLETPNFANITTIEGIRQLAREPRYDVGQKQDIARLYLSLIEGQIAAGNTDNITIYIEIEEVVSFGRMRLNSMDRLFIIAHAASLMKQIGEEEKAHRYFIEALNIIKAPPQSVHIGEKTNLSSPIEELQQLEILMQEAGMTAEAEETSQILHQWRQDYFPIEMRNRQLDRFYLDLTSASIEINNEDLLELAFDYLTSENSKYIACSRIKNSYMSSLKWQETCNKISPIEVITYEDRIENTLALLAAADIDELKNNQAVAEIFINEIKFTIRDSNFVIIRAELAIMLAEIMVNIDKKEDAINFLKEILQTIASQEEAEMLNEAIENLEG